MINSYNIGFELVHKLGEICDIFCHRGCLSDVVDLANKEFMLVAIEMITNHDAKLLPRSIPKFRLDRIIPTR